MKKDYSDAELVALYIESKGAEFLTELFTRHSDIVYRTALRIMKNPSDAEDILQTVYCKVITNLHMYKGTGSVIGWMLQVVIHTCYNQLNSEKSRLNREKKIMSERVHMTTPKNEELKEMMENHLNKLPEIYKAPITLQIMEGLSIKEVSEALEIPEKTIRSQIARGLEKLKVSLQNVGVTASVISIGDMLKEIHQPLAPEAIKSSQYFNAIIQSKTAVSAKMVAATSGKGFLLQKAIALGLIAMASISGFFVWQYVAKSNMGIIPVATNVQKWDFENSNDLASYQKIGLLKGSIALKESVGFKNSAGLMINGTSLIELDISNFQLPIKISYLSDELIQTDGSDLVQMIFRNDYKKDQTLTQIFGLRERIKVNYTSESLNFKQGYLGTWFEHTGFIDENTIDFYVKGKRSHYAIGESTSNKKIYLYLRNAIIDNLVIESIDRNLMPKKLEVNKIALTDLPHNKISKKIDKEIIGIQKDSSIDPIYTKQNVAELEDEIGLNNEIIYPILGEANRIVWSKVRQKISRKWDFENAQDLSDYKNVGILKGKMEIVASRGVGDSNGLMVEDNSLIEFDISNYQLPLKISYVADVFTANMDLGQIIVKKNYVSNKNVLLLSDLREKINTPVPNESINAKLGYLGYWYPHVNYYDEKAIDLWVDGKRSQVLWGTSNDNKKLYLYINGKSIIDNLTIESIAKENLPEKNNIEKIIANFSFKNGVANYNLDKAALGLAKIPNLNPLMRVAVPNTFETSVGLNRKPVYASIDTAKKIVWENQRQKVTKKWDFENTKDLDVYKDIGVTKGFIGIESSKGKNNSNSLLVRKDTTIEIDISKYEMPIRISYVTDFLKSNNHTDYGQLAIKGNLVQDQEIYYITNIRGNANALELERNTNEKFGYLGRWFEHIAYVDKDCIDIWIAGKRAHYLKGNSSDDKKLYLYIASDVVIDELIVESIDKSNLPDKSVCEKVISTNTYQEGVENYFLDKSIFHLEKEIDLRPYLQKTTPLTFELLPGVKNAPLYASFGNSNQIEWVNRRQKVNKKWEFEKPEELADFKLIRGKIEISPSKGESQTSCLLVAAETVIEIDISKYQMPLKLTHSFDFVLPPNGMGKGIVMCKNNYELGKNIFNFGNLSIMENINISESAKKFKNDNVKAGFIGEWYSRTLYVSTDGIDSWFLNKRSGVLLGTSTDNNKLYFYVKDLSLIDNFTIESVEPEIVPDLSVFKSFANKVPFEKGSRGHDINNEKANLKLDNNSKPVLGIYDTNSFENALGLLKN